MSQPVNRTAARVLSLVMVVLCMVAVGVGVRLSQEEKPYEVIRLLQILRLPDSHKTMVENAFRNFW